MIEFKRKFKRSILGYFWIIAQPLLMILMYWFAFSSAGQTNTLRINGVDYNWLAWVLIGCFTWTYFSDLLSFGPSSVRLYFWMVKNYGVKPFVIIIFTNISRLIIALISIAIALIITMIINGTDNNPDTPIFTAKTLEIIIYIFFMFILMFTYSFAFSNLFLISKDIQNLITIVPVFLAWVSAVFLLPNESNGNEVVNVILQINPFYFVINGFRSVMLGYGDLFSFYPLYQWYSLLSYFLFVIFFFGVGIFLNSKFNMQFILDIIT